MKDTPEYRVASDEVIQLLAEQPMVRLVTVDPEGWPRVGLHVFVSRGAEVEVHLANDDPQLADIRRTGRVVIEVDDVLSFSPSHWVDETNAAHADQYFRCAVMRGEPDVIAERATVVEHLRALLARYQPEGRYTGVDEGPALYDAYIDRLTIVRLAPADVTTKFKLAQKTSSDARLRIIEHLRTTGGAQNQATSVAIERHNGER